MLKYEIKVKEVILNEWVARELKGNEWRSLGKCNEKRNNLYKSLNRKQKEMLLELEECYDKDMVQNEQNLVEFVLEFIKAIYKWTDKMRVKKTFSLIFLFNGFVWFLIKWLWGEHENCCWVCFTWKLFD